MRASIRGRLVLGLVVILSLVIIEAFVGMRHVGTLSRISDESAAAMGRAELLSLVSSALAEHRGAEISHILRSDPEAFDRHQQYLGSLWIQAEDSFQAYRSEIDDPGRLADHDAVMEHLADYVVYRRDLLANIRAENWEEAHGLSASFQDDFDEIMAHMYQLRQEEIAVSTRLVNEARDSATRTRYLFIASTLLIASLGLGFVLFFWRSVSRGMGRLLEGTRRVSMGDFSRPVPEDSADEFGQLARSFNVMLQDIKQAEQENLRLTTESLRMREEHVRLLRDRLVREVRAQEEERQRIARELHDQAGQALLALHWGLARLDREADSPELKQQVSSLDALTMETMEDIRNLARDLRPASLDELGLVPALHRHIQDFSARVGIPIDLKITGVLGRTCPELEVAVFRAVQEALTNMAKHSHAGHANVVLTADATKLEVRVEDDGVGFDVASVVGSANRKALGLFGMQERVELVGGSLHIQSEPRKGTRLTISAPLDRDAPTERNGEGSGENAKSATGG